MPDFGIGEAIAAFTGADLFGGAAAAGAGAEAAGGGLLADAGAAALGPAATSLTVNALPGAAAGGFGFGDALAGAGAGLAAGAGAFGNALFPAAGAAPLGVGAQPGLPTSAAGGGQPGGGTAPGVQDFLKTPGAPAGPSGVGAGAFSPAPGVSLPGGIAPDATSAAALQPSADTFATRAGAVTDAVQSGVFDPVGPNFTTFAGPQGTPGFPAAGTPTASPSIGDFTTSPTAGTPGGPANTNPFLPSGLPNYAAYPEAGGIAAPEGAAGSAGASEGGGFLGKLGQGAVDSVTKNPLGIALGAGGLGYSILSGKTAAAKEKSALSAIAARENAQGAQLEGYLTSGTLPAGLQTSVDQATASAKARAIANAASQGLPTDPTKNTALATTLSAIDQQATATVAQIGQQLLTSGIAESGLSEQVYNILAGIDQTQTNSIGKAIANMAGALNTSSGPRIQIGGTAA